MSVSPLKNGASTSNLSARVKVMLGPSEASAASLHGCCVFVDVLKADKGSSRYYNVCYTCPSFCPSFRPSEYFSQCPTQTRTGECVANVVLLHHSYLGHVSCRSQPGSLFFLIKSHSTHALLVSSAGAEEAGHSSLGSQPRAQAGHEGSRGHPGRPDPAHAPGLLAVTGLGRARRPMAAPAATAAANAVLSNSPCCSVCHSVACMCYQRAAGWPSSAILFIMTMDMHKSSLFVQCCFLIRMDGGIQDDADTFRSKSVLPYRLGHCQ